MLIRKMLNILLSIDSPSSQFPCTRLNNPLPRGCHYFFGRGCFSSSKILFDKIPPAISNLIEASYGTKGSAILLTTYILKPLTAYTHFHFPNHRLS